MAPRPRPRRTHSADSPAWHESTSPITANANRSWDDFRGHAKVNVVQGSGANRTKTETRYFRGMHGDDLTGGGNKTVTLDSVLFAGGPWKDQNWLRGQRV